VKSIGCNALTTSLFYAAKREGLTIRWRAADLPFRRRGGGRGRRARRSADCVQTLSSLFHLDRQTIELLPRARP
jgi:hypothetical protein